MITVSSSARGGDIGYCRICGNQHRLHRDGDTFVAEPTGAKGSAEELKPRPETVSIETLAKAVGAALAGEPKR